MSHPSNGIIDLYNSGDESVGSDVEEVVQWDKELRGTKTFMTAVTILSGRKYSSPNQESQHKVLLLFIDQPAHGYFRSKSSQMKAFDNLKEIIHLGWNTENGRKKKWTVRFTAENLALLLVLRRQVEKEKENALVVERPTRSALTGVPKATPLKRAFRKLWKLYEEPLKLYVQAERIEANKVHRTPSLSLQLTGSRAQDLVPWARFTKCQSNCPKILSTSLLLPSSISI
jgi:hypothetical protein